MLALVFSLFLGAPGWASSPPAAPSSVPAVAVPDFRPGRYWQWNYLDPSAKIYSSERYTVISNQNGLVTLEMASHFPGETVFKATHRLLVPVADCLRAYANPVDIQPWAFRMFFLEGGVWQETEPPSTLAFEEKFNCNPHVLDSPDYLTVFRQSPAGAVFAQKHWRRLDGSWYMFSGANAGVVFTKDFPHGGTSDDTYRMQFDSAGE